MRYTAANTVKRNTEVNPYSERGRFLMKRGLSPFHKEPSPYVQILCKQNDKPGYVVGRSSIQTCCYQQVQATYLKRDGPPHHFYSVLLRMGFTCALRVTTQAVVSYTAFPPLPIHSVGGLFLLHWPWSHLHRTLSGILPCEARTFLV